MNQNEQHPLPSDTPAGPEQGLKSASTAGDNHGATADSDFPKEATRGENDKTGAERREELKED